MKLPHITLKQLHVFVAVAQHGSTAAAGNAVALSQSAVSAALNELERLLGAELFERIGKRLVLNERGSDVLLQCRALLDLASDIETSAQTRQRYLRGVKIGASTTIGNYILPKLLQTWVGSQPTLQWQSEIVVLNTAEVCRKVAQFELDIGLIEGRCRETALQAWQWRSDEMTVVVSPRHALHEAVHSGDAERIRQGLRAATWLLREQGSGTRSVCDGILLPKLAHYANWLELGSSEAIKQCAVAGLGVACLSRYVVADELQHGSLCELAQLFEPTERPLFWVCHPDKLHHTQVRQVLADLGCLTEKSG